MGVAQQLDFEANRFTGKAQAESSLVRVLSAFRWISISKQGGFFFANWND